MSLAKSALYGSPRNNTCFCLYFRRIKDIEELSNALFLRTADTNKFLREDSNKALDAMIDNVKFSKCVVILTQKVAK